MRSLVGAFKLHVCMHTPIYNYTHGGHVGCRCVVLNWSVISYVHHRRSGVHRVEQSTVWYVVVAQVFRDSRSLEQQFQRLLEIEQGTRLIIIHKRYGSI